MTTAGGTGGSYCPPLPIRTRKNNKKLNAACRTHSAYCTDAGLMLKIKNLMMLFASTLRSYGYAVDRLFELLQELRLETLLS